MPLFPIIPGILSDGSLIAPAATIRTNLGIGTSDNPTFGNVTVSNLTVNGTVSTVNSATITVDDPLIRLGDNNAADSVDLGWYGLYVSSGSKYAGIFRDASDGKFKAFTALQEEPGTTVNIAGTGYAVATLVANVEGAVNGVTLTTGGSAATFLNAAGNYVSAGASAHSALTGLTSGDDHTQYALLAGRSGGQTIIGGTAASNNLTLRGTSHGTPGVISCLSRLEATGAIRVTGFTAPTTGAGMNFYYAGGVSGFSSYDHDAAIFKTMAFSADPFTFNSQNGEQVRITAVGNFGIGITTFGTSAEKVFSIANATAPGSSVADSFQMYSKDQAAGNACPHIRTENGAVIKLFQAPKASYNNWAAFTDVVNALVALGLFDAA